MYWQQLSRRNGFFPVKSRFILTWKRQSEKLFNLNCKRQFPAYISIIVSQPRRRKLSFSFTIFYVISRPSHNPVKVPTEGRKGKEVPWFISKIMGLNDRREIVRILWCHHKPIEKRSEPEMKFLNVELMENRKGNYCESIRSFVSGLKRLPSLPPWSIYHSQEVRTSAAKIDHH